VHLQTDRTEQMDIAEGLLNMGGLEPSIACLASNHSIIRQRAAEVIAAAVQNLDRLKEAAHNASALPKLIAVYVNRYESHETRSKALHAISALIQGNSSAELSFLFNQVCRVLSLMPLCLSLYLSVSLALLSLSLGCLSQSL